MRVPVPSVLRNIPTSQGSRMVPVWGGCKAGTKQRRHNGVHGCFLYFKQEGGTESVYRGIRLLGENGRWIVAEASERNEEIYRGGKLSGSVPEEILGLAEGQMSQGYPGYDEYGIGTTSKTLSITDFGENESREIIIAKRLSFRIKEAEDGYRLDECRL